MVTVNPYIIYNGNCEEAFNHYKTVFGGEFSMLSRFSEMPPREGFELGAGDKDLIMHIELPVGRDSVLMGSDSGGEQGPETIVGNNITLSISAESKEQADLFFKKLSEDGRVNMPMENTFWGSYFGMCTDRFDVNWMISFEQEAQG